MKKFSFKLALVALAAMAVVSCNKEEGTDGFTYEKLDLVGEKITDVIVDGTLTISEDSYLTAPLYVADGGELIIEKGVQIMTEDNGAHIYILVQQGGKITAEGTAAEPIVMTAQYQKPGAWGGIHICGKAPINTTSNTSEVGEKLYGGSISDDNSGTLEYVVVEYAGYLHSTEKEANGFTFYGVGSETKVSHCVAYRGADDGFEFFGGTVNATYLVSVGNQDDLFDWTEGWVGKGQFWIGDQINNDCDQTVEGDNSKSAPTATPISCPTLSNLTLIGDDNGGNTSGALLRNGTHFKIYNSIATGKTNDIRLSDTNSGDATYPTSASLAATTSVLTNFYCTGTPKDDASTNDLSGCQVTDTFTYTSTYGTYDNTDLVSDNFFTAVSSCGAAAGSDWNWSSVWGLKVAGYLAE